MSGTRIALIGYLGPLAHATSENLQRRGNTVELLERSNLPEQLSPKAPSSIICFPFPASMRHAATKRWEEDLKYLESVLEWSRTSGVARAVLRSHALAYGSSMKNPGLMSEGRRSLLPKNSLERRWLQAETRLFEAIGPRTAVIRLTSILDPEEGDFISRMLRQKVAVPLAGYDPQVQFLSLSDAANALALAALSDASGMFNVSGEGTISFKEALRWAVPVRVSLGQMFQKPIRSALWKAGFSCFPAESLEQIRYNWTISSERARKEFSFAPQMTTTQALQQFLNNSHPGKAARLRQSYDDFGLDPDYVAAWEPWFYFLRKIYWRVEVEGIEHVPGSGAGLLVSNHRGFMPFDGVIHRSLIQHAVNRHVRFLVIPSLFKFPFLSDFLIKQGGVVASQENAKRLFERRELVGIFPEGINGAFRMYRGAYQLGEMSKDIFAKMAIENGIPIIPAATIGHVEIFPILAKIHISAMTRWNGWPYLPITPTFPLLPVPLPSKWHIRYLEPIPVGNLSPADAKNPKAVKDFSRYVGHVIQQNVDEMLTRRKHIFFGNIFRRPANTAQQESVAAGGQ